LLRRANPEGIVPAKQLGPRLRLLSWVKDDRLEGIVPVKLFPRIKTLNCVKDPRVEGSVPPKESAESLRNVSSVSDPIIEGRDPEKLG
jgi:hypothetical protein